LEEELRRSLIFCNIKGGIRREGRSCLCVTRMCVCVCVFLIYYFIVPR